MNEQQLDHAGLYDIVLDRVTRLLSDELSFLTSDSTKGIVASKRYEALTTVIAYVPLTFITDKPEATCEVEALDDALSGWLLDFGNMVTMDWALHLTTLGTDAMATFTNGFARSIMALRESSMMQSEYSARISTTAAKDVGNITYYLLATAYLRIGKGLGVNNG